VTPDQRDFVWRTHSYVNDYIHLADAKAGALFGVFGALLGVLVHQWAASAEPETWWRKALFASALGAGSLVIFLALQVVRPRLDSPAMKNSSGATCAIYWRRVCGQSIDQYRRAVEALDDDGMLSAVVAHTWEISRVAERKYGALTMAFLTSFIALPLGLLGIAVL